MAEVVELCVVFPDGRQLLQMTSSENNQFRLEVTSVGGHLRYGDTIEVGAPLKDGAVPYRRVIRRSGLRTECFLVPKGLMESLNMRKFVEGIHSLAGHCKGIAGGVFIVHLPRKFDLDVKQELKRIKQSQK